jgi:hypothetical protein
MGFECFVCLCGAQFFLQIITAPLFVYQSELLCNSAMGMSTAIRAFIFMHVKSLVTSLMEPTKQNPAPWKADIGDIFNYFAYFQLVAVVFIFIFLIETKGVEDKKNAANPVKAAAKAAAKKAAQVPTFVETRVWEEDPFKRKESKLQKKIDAFISKCFETRHLDENVDCLSKYKV